MVPEIITTKTQQLVDTCLHLLTICIDTLASPYSAAGETGFNCGLPLVLFRIFSLLGTSMTRWSWPAYSLKFAALSRFFTSSITSSSRTTISTSNDANAAKGSASENSRFVTAILLSVGRSVALSSLRSAAAGGSVPVLFRSNGDIVSVLDEGRSVALNAAAVFLH
jgi:hypothetical protein